uniref:Ladderlectin-like n=1 Tax=Poecilia latipinna TaxID=48699 RepID=A0A3B3USW4_9TELE
MKLLTVSILLFALLALSCAAGTSLWTIQNHVVKRTTSCPSGWTLYRSRCFRYFSSAYTWAQAERNCISMGGNLASVHSSEEYHEIQSLIMRATYAMKVTWIGGSDATEVSTWSWSDGSLMTFTNWCPGEPNNGGWNQDCMQMNYSGEKCWDDYRCSFSLPSVCVLKNSKRN